MAADDPPRPGSGSRSQTEVVAQERNAVVLAEKAEHLRHGAEGSSQAGPERGAVGNRAANQLSEGFFEGLDSRNQGTPRSSEATGLHDPGRRVQALRLDPRPLVQIPLQPLRSHRPVGQPMGGQHRKGPTTRRTKITLDPLHERLLRIGIPLVAPVAVNSPRTTPGTHRPFSSELVFAQLDRPTSPKSSRPFKPPDLGLHDASHRHLLTNVPPSRPHPTSQRYSIRSSSQG